MKPKVAIACQGGGTMIRIKYLLLIIILSLAIEFNVPNALAENSLSCPKEMVYISGGNFRMGSDRKDFLEERTVDDVTVDSYSLTPKMFNQF